MTQSQAGPSPTGERGLVRALGTWALAAGIVNVTIGGGIFRLPGSMAAMLGAAAPLAYLVCAVAMGLIVLCIAEAGSRVSLTGGPYAYVELAFGPFVGFLSGVLLWLLGTFAVAAVSTVFAVSVGRLVPALGTPAASAALLAVAFAVVATVNIRGVRQGTRLNNVATVAKLLPLFLLLAAGLFAVRTEHLQVVETPGLQEILRASIILIFAFAGIESALVPSGEVRDPARTVPRAVFIAMSGITLLYIALQLVVQGVLGARLGSDEVVAAPLAAAAGVALGGWGSTLLLVGAVISTFGYLSGMTLAVPRALFALGRDGFLPRAVAAVHPRYHTPWIAIIVQSVVVWLLAAFNAFEALAVLANLATLLLYLGCCLAAWELRRRNVRIEGATPFRVPAAGVIPLLGCLVIAGLLTSITRREWAVMLGVLALASVAYFATAGVRARRVA